MNILPPLLFSLFLAGLFALPVAWGFVRGIESAADPSHRSTPASPWHFFDHTWRRWRRRVVGIVVMICACWLFYAIFSTNSYFTRRFYHLALESATIAAIPLFLLFANVGFCYAAAPYYRNIAGLAALAACLSVLSFVVGFILLTFSPFPPSFITFQIWMKNGYVLGSNQLNITPFYLVFLAALFWLAASFWAHRKNERWFRFAE